jgi:hypothetical protein
MSEAGIKVFDDIDSNDQRATARQEIMRMLDACYVEILREKKAMSRLTSVLEGSSSSGTRASPPILQDTGGDDPYDPPTVLPLKLSFVITLFCKFSISIKYYRPIG